jgi:DNA-binding phage protein
MVTQQQLADMLAGVNVEDVARAADVSTKTIYRLRRKQHSPTLGTVEKILAAIAVVQAPAVPVEPAREAA